MNLKQQIDRDIKSAMLAKEKDKLRALRAIKSMILLAETEKGAKEELSKDSEIKLLMKATKQRKDSYNLYVEQGREDLAKVEKDELKIINEYLPKQMTKEEVTEELKKIIKQISASSLQDMGKVMGNATKILAGKADGKMISTIVKQLLTS